MYDVIKEIEATRCYVSDLNDVIVATECQIESLMKGAEDQEGDPYDFCRQIAESLEKSVVKVKALRDALVKMQII